MSQEISGRVHEEIRKATGADHGVLVLSSYEDGTCLVEATDLDEAVRLREVARGGMAALMSVQIFVPVGV